MRDEKYSGTPVDAAPPPAGTLDRSVLLGFKTLTALSARHEPSEGSLALLHNKIGEGEVPPVRAAPILATEK